MSNPSKPTPSFGNQLGSGSKEDDDLLTFAEEGEEDLLFADEDEPILVSDRPEKLETWDILIVDDEVEIHNVTKLALSDFVFEKKGLRFFSAFSGQEARNIIDQHPNMALVLLDVIMETDDAGLEVVKYIRNTLKNYLVRIILRTGQPGQVPEDVVTLNYDINDYKTKTELTTQKLFTALVTAFRAFAVLQRLEESKRELEKIALASARFVPTQFLHLLKKTSIVDVQLGDQVQKVMSVIFSDIRNFTALSEQMTPEENFKFINSFLSYMEPAIIENQGFIDKYIGDAIMALFTGTADNAVKAGMTMLERLKDYNNGRQNAGYEPISIGIGINTGSLMLGMVGGQSRMDGTVISDAVNLASRLEGLTKNYGVSLLISHATFVDLQNPNLYGIRLIDRTTVKGKSSLVSVYEVFGADPSPLKEAKLATKSTFEEAVTLYHQGQFDKSHQLFLESLRRAPDDCLVQMYIKRCQEI